MLDLHVTNLSLDTYSDLRITRLLNIELVLWLEHSQMWSQYPQCGKKRITEIFKWLKYYFLAYGNMSIIPVCQENKKNKTTKTYNFPLLRMAYVTKFRNTKWLQKSGRKWMLLVGCSLNFLWKTIWRYFKN